MDLSKLSYMDLPQLIYEFFWVFKWICQSCYMDLLKFFYVFLAVCQTKPSFNKISKLDEASAFNQRCRVSQRTQYLGFVYSINHFQSWSNFCFQVRHCWHFPEPLLRESDQKPLLEDGCRRSSAHNILYSLIPTTSQMAGLEKCKNGAY